MDSILCLPIKYDFLINKYYKMINENIEDNIEPKANEEYNLYKIGSEFITPEPVVEQENVYNFSRGNNKITDTTIPFSLNEKMGSTVNLSLVKASLIDTTNLKLQKTDIACWWCCHSFDNYPVSIPVKFYPENYLFKCKGIFCSFPCALSYSSQLKITDRSLLKMLYRKILNLNSDVIEIKKAPNKEVLKMFGGPMDIQTFRDDSNNKLFNINSYPVIYMNEQLHTQSIYGSSKVKMDITKNVLKNTTIKSAKERLSNTKTEKIGYTIAEKLSNTK
jgi:hypothetical protein